MLKLKYILNDLIDYAYRGDPKLPQYKRFYVEYLKKKLKTRNGDYRSDNRHLRIFTEGREDVQIIKTSIHELSHHVDYMQRGKSCHDAAFYGIYEKLLFAALKGITRFRVMKAYEIREQLKKRGYTFNTYDRTWEKEAEGEGAVLEEERYLRGLGAEFSTEDARRLTF